MKKTQLRGVLMLLLTAFIWGTAFVAQSVGMEQIEGFTFTGIRTLMGSAVLLPVILIKDSIGVKSLSTESKSAKKAADKKALIYGSILGVVFCAASNFQQFAFNYSTSGKIAFVTALYIFFVPLFGLLFKKKIPALTWVCVISGFIGLYFLCIDPNNLGSINKGDILAAVCALLFAVHIMMVDRFSPEVDGIKLSCVQFAVAGIISCVLMFIFETPEISAIKSAIVPLLYSGVMSCGLAYTFQIVGQKYTEPTIASLLMCMESVFAVLSAAILLHETLSGREILGCVIMFAAIVLAQLAEIIPSKIKIILEMRRGVLTGRGRNKTK